MRARTVSHLKLGSHRLASRSQTAERNLDARARRQLDAGEVCYVHTHANVAGPGVQEARLRSQLETIDHEVDDRTGSPSYPRECLEVGPHRGARPLA